jgi:hypothetical protein
MNEVQFEENQYSQANNASEQQQNWIVRSLMKIRWVQNEAQAFKIMLGVIVLIVILSVYIFWSSGSSNNGPPVDPENDPTTLIDF